MAGDVNIKYRASATLTINPENVASSSTFVAGVESDVYDNTTNKDIDVLVSGRWRSGTTPTANTQVQIYVVAALDDTPNYPDVFDGTHSTETVTSAGVRNGLAKLAAILDVDSNTTGRDYYCAPFSVAALFGGVLPAKWVLFITHNTGVNSDTTAGNFVWKTNGITYTLP